MKIEVYNLNRILTNTERCGKKGEPQNLISIRDSYFDGENSEKYAALDRRIKRYGINALVVAFDDIDPYRFKFGMEHPTIKKKFEDGTNIPIFFNSEIAKDIERWVYNIWKNDHDCTIKVHCWAGRSRSQAVAYWLNMYFNLILDRNIGDYVANNKLNVVEKVHFNCEVLRVFTDTFG